METVENPCTQAGMKSNVNKQSGKYKVQAVHWEEGYELLIVNVPQFSLVQRVDPSVDIDIQNSLNMVSMDAWETLDDKDGSMPLSGNKISKSKKYKIAT